MNFYATNTQRKLKKSSQLYQVLVEFMELRELVLAKLIDVKPLMIFFKENVPHNGDTEFLYYLYNEEINAINNFLNGAEAVDCIFCKPPTKFTKNHKKYLNIFYDYVVRIMNNTASHKDSEFADIVYKIQSFNNDELNSIMEIEFGQIKIKLTNQ